MLNVYKRIQWILIKCVAVPTSEQQHKRLHATGGNVQIWKGLYTLLIKKTPTITHFWTNILISDSELSAIHLPKATQDKTIQEKYLSAKQISAKEKGQIRKF